MKFKKIIVWKILVYSCLPPILGTLGRWNWFLDIFSQFRIQELILLILATVTLLILKEWKKAIVTFVVFCYFVVPVLNYIPRSYSVVLPPKEKTISVLYINLGTPRGTDNLVVNFLSEYDADIVVLSEIRERTYNRFKEILDKYQTQHIVKREDNFGIALYSKFPINNLETKYYSSSGVPSIRGTFRFTNHDVTMIATHPVPPVRPQYWNWRNEQFDALAKEIKDDPNQVIMVGDLNTSPWSYWYQTIRTAGLRDSAYDIGWRPTWPSYWPKILRVPLDYVHVSPRFLTLENSTLGFTGSDHFPIFVRLGLWE